MNTETRRSSLPIVRLTAADAASFRAVRLDGLHRHPEAFGASWEDEARLTEAQFADRLEHTVIFGARTVDGDRLVGMVGLRFPEAVKIKHKATLWGMYVLPEARRTGVGAALVATAVDYALSRVDDVLLTVGAANMSALALYSRAGFTQYGLERRALKVGDVYHDEALMCLVV